jgi:hypothetical protein
MTNATKIFLDTLFARSANGTLFVTSLANDRALATKLAPRQIVTRDVEAIRKFMLGYDVMGRACYVCVATIKMGITRRAKANLADLVTLHADLDFKGIALAPADIERLLKLMEPRPSLAVHSGHGIHLYWVLKEPLPATPENIARVEWSLRKFAYVLAGDPQVCECARLMRLVGSHNSKNGGWERVIILHWSDERYALADLECWLRGTSRPMLPRAVSTKTGVRNGGAQNGARSGASDPFLQLGEEQFVPAPIDVEQRLEEMTHHGTNKDGIHDSQLSVSAALLKRGHSIDDVVERVIEATREAAGREGNGWDWRAEEKAVRRMCVKWLEKHPVAVCDEEDFEARHVLEEIDFEAGYFIDEE